MACGAPVITGGTGALAEVGGDAIMPLDRVDADVIGRALVALANSRDRREALSAAGVERSARFSWDRAARESLDIYREAGRLRARRRLAPPMHDRSPADGAPVAEPHQGAAALSHAESGVHRPAAGSYGTDVLFGQAYFLRFDPQLWEAQQPYAPLRALYAAPCTREPGYRLHRLDEMLAAGERECAAALDPERPRFAVIYEDNFNYLSKMCLLRMRQAALTMIGPARARGITTIVAGADAPDHPASHPDRGAAGVRPGQGRVSPGRTT